MYIHFMEKFLYGYLHFTGIINLVLYKQIYIKNTANYKKLYKKSPNTI